MSRSHFNDRILRGFILSSDALFEIRQLLDRRQKTKFSEGLSPEARMVLQQMEEDTRENLDEDSDDNSAGEDEQQYTERKGSQKPRKSIRKFGREKSRRQISFTDSPRGQNRGMKFVAQTKDVINTSDMKSSSITTGRDASGKEDMIITTEPNPVDKCREWVTDNGVETFAV